MRSEVGGGGGTVWPRVDRGDGNSLHCANLVLCM